MGAYWRQVLVLGICFAAVVALKIYFDGVVENLGAVSAQEAQDSSANAALSQPSELAVTVEPSR